MDYIKIGEFLKSLRKAKGLTQQEVADELFVSQKTISKWERGDGVPDITIVGSVASFYGVTVDELLNGERGKPNLSEYTIKAKEGEKLKLFKRKLTNFLNIFHISALATGLVFLLLDCLLGFLVKPFVGVLLGGIGLALSAVVFLIGFYLAYEKFDNNDAGLSDKEKDSLKLILRKKLLLFHDLFSLELLASAIIYTTLYCMLLTYISTNDVITTISLILFELFFAYSYLFIRELIKKPELRNNDHLYKGLFIPAIVYTIFSIVTFFIIRIFDYNYPVIPIFDVIYGFFYVFVNPHRFEIGCIVLTIMSVAALVVSIISYKLKRIWILLITLTIGLASVALYREMDLPISLSVSGLGIASLILALALIGSAFILELKLKKEGISDSDTNKDEAKSLTEGCRRARNTFIILSLIGTIIGSAIMLVSAGDLTNEISYVISPIGFLVGMIIIILAHVVAKLMLKKDTTLTQEDRNDTYYLFKRKYSWILDIFIGLAVLFGSIISIKYIDNQNHFEPRSAAAMRLGFVLIFSIIYILIRKLIINKKEVSYKNINKVIVWGIGLTAILMILSFLQLEVNLPHAIYEEYNFSGVILLVDYGTVITYQAIAVVVEIIAIAGILLSASFNKQLPIYPSLILGIAIQNIITKDFVAMGYNELRISASYLGFAEVIFLAILVVIGIVNYISHKIRNK